MTPTKGAPVKKAKKSELPLPPFAYARCTGTVKRSYRDQSSNVNGASAFAYLNPTLWLVQKGRKRASFTNVDAARAFAGKTGKIRAFVEVQA